MIAPPPRELYVALKPDEAIQTEIRRYVEAWTWPTQAWRMPPAGYHLSLLSFGEDFPDAMEAWVRAELRKVAMEPLELVLHTAEQWKNKRAVLCPAPHEGLYALQERLADRFQRKEPFTPHVTLAHGASHAVPPPKEPAIRWRVREFALMWFDQQAKTHVVSERYPVNVDVAPPRRKPPTQGDLF